MALSAKLHLRQAQTLVITPQLLQAIRLLQMSGLELERFVAAEIEQNPLLEQDDSADGPADGGIGSSGEAAELAAGGPAGDVDAEPGDLFPELPRPYRDPPANAPLRSASPSQEVNLLEQALAAPASLAELLDRTIEAAFAHSPADRLIATALRCELDEAGYLTVSADDLAVRLGAAPEDVERVLRRCQEIAPTGIFARSLAECLALQLAERDRLDPAMQALLANLPLLAAGDRIGLCRLCGVDREDLDEMVAEIRALDAKPGLAWAHQPVAILPPDAIVRRAPDGGWSVELNDEMLPRLVVNRVYFARISARARGEAERKYLAECLQKASWLEKSLDQRARTILNVATEIVRRQRDFLANGVSGLRPLNLRMVADSIGVHESTVSRAAANKTIATPRGVFEFRYFFTATIPATTGGEGHSAAAVKHRIRRLILEEAPESVLSDDAIVATLSREGVEIARRTVAKYRELMRIGSSVERRRQKRRSVAS